MEKIISLFQRNYDGDRQVRDEVVPGAEWVQAGEGTASIKWDGTCCMVRDGRLYKRYDAYVSGKKKRTPPADFEPAQAEADPVTGHWPGWVPVGDGPEDRWHREAFSNAVDEEGNPNTTNGTYELCGPKVQGNPYGLRQHVLYRHGSAPVRDCPTDFLGLKRMFEEWPDFEGIVWHHPDGRMVKAKRRDWGLPWPVKDA